MLLTSTERTRQTNSTTQGVALIAGVTGLSGSSLAHELLEQGWTVYGISRRAPQGMPDVRHVAADLTDAEATKHALRGLPITHAFFNTWAAQESEQKSIEVNGAMMRSFLHGIDGTADLQHVGLVTGMKHYVGPFEAQARIIPVTPFREGQSRLDYPNFYYEVLDVLIEESQRRGFTWNDHRPHTLIGYGLANQMNMGVTLALYGTICRETGRKFTFPGTQAQWNGLNDVTDVRILAQHMHWAATIPEAANEALNVVNGDVFRWSQLWPALAEALGAEPEPWSETNQPLAEQMADAPSVWPGIAQKHGLEPVDIENVASWWHTDADLGREYEAVTDMSKSRRLGFSSYQTTEQSFRDVFAYLREANIIP